MAPAHVAAGHIPEVARSSAAARKVHHARCPREGRVSLQSHETYAEIRGFPCLCSRGQRAGTKPPGSKYNCVSSCLTPLAQKNHQVWVKSFMGSTETTGNAARHGGCVQLKPAWGCRTPLPWGHTIIPALTPAVLRCPGASLGLSSGSCGVSVLPFPLPAPKPG